MPSIELRAEIGDYHTTILRADRKAKTALRNALRREVNHHISRLNTLVSGWSHEVTFKPRTSLRISDQVLGIGIVTTDAIFGFLDQGTSHRTRRMNPDYMPKTQYQTFYQTGPGGYVVGKAAMPGIEGREWFGFIEEDFDRAIFDTTIEVLQDFVKDANDW